MSFLEGKICTIQEPSIINFVIVIVKHAIGALLKICGRNNITIGTWNTRTLGAAGKLQELTHKMDRYRWNVLGLCEMKWKNFGETATEEGHKLKKKKIP